MLGIGVAAQASGTLVVTTPAMLIPLFHTELGLGIAQVGLLAALPTFGMVLTLVLWGAVTDRYGERWVLAGGLLLTVAATAGATERSSCSQAWQRRPPMRRAVASSSAGSPPGVGDWPWASARPANHSGSR